MTMTSAVNHHPMNRYQRARTTNGNPRGVVTTMGVLTFTVTVGAAGAFTSRGDEPLCHAWSSEVSRGDGTRGPLVGGSPRSGITALLRFNPSGEKSASGAWPADLGQQRMARQNTQS